jgi:hypothetical protein
VVLLEVGTKEDAAGFRYSTASSSLALEFASSLRVSFIRCSSKYSLALLRLVSALSKAASEAVFDSDTAFILIAFSRSCV